MNELFALADRALEHHRTNVIRRALMRTDPFKPFEMTDEEHALMNRLYKARSFANEYPGLTQPEFLTHT